MNIVPIRVLLVEDDREDYLFTNKILTDSDRAAFEVKWVRSCDAALEELRNPYDVCVVDYRLGAENGLTLIAKATADGFHPPMILLTGRGDHDVDVQAMKAGAADYLLKDQITPQLMERVIRYSIERQGAQVALRKSEEQLRQSQKMEAIGSLAGGVAHDFNNLLSVILSYSELLANDLKPGDPMRAELEDINQAGLRAADLTRQLLAFSRQQVLEPRVVDLNDVFAGMESMLRRMIGSDVELTSLAGPSLGKILVDPGQMEQIIMNLVVNARDAMPSGGGLTIETADVLLSDRDAAELPGLHAGPHVMLAVSDTGVGMDQATQARIFEPFFTTKEIGRGTGLGLSIVFGIVRQSGGAISVRSQPGNGTAFTAYFPVTDGAAIHQSGAAEAVPEPRTLRGSETILVVEDEERVRVLVRTILRKYGYKVLEAQSGGDALIVCEQHEPSIDLLLADVVLARMNGPQLAARLVTTRPDMKVLYMSGNTGSAMLQRATRASGAGFLQKPITPETLIRHVREALRSSPDPSTAASL
jgi:two-component system cell cycle sensor histidine kinase/response regulator CckA